MSIYFRLIIIVTQKDILHLFYNIHNHFYVSYNIQFTFFNIHVSMKTFFNTNKLYNKFCQQFEWNNNSFLLKKCNLPFYFTLLLFMGAFHPSAMAQTGGNGVPPGMSKLTIQLLLNTNPGGSNTADGCVVAYKNGFTNAIGPEDSYKFYNVDENLALPVGNILLSVEGKPLLVSYDTIPLKIWQYRQSDYYLKFEGINFAPNMEGVLKDSYLNQDNIISLTGSTTIHFTLNTDTASRAANRFCIFLRPVSVLPLSLISFSAAQKDNNILVEWNVANTAESDHFEVLKATNPLSFYKIADLKTSTTGNLKYQWLDQSTATGVVYYKLKTIGKSGEVQYSKIVKVNVGTGVQGINIYPNPVKGNTIGLQMFNMEKDNYQVKIYNINGQQAYTSSLPYMGGSITQQLIINKTLIKGSYTIRITNGKNEYNKTLLID